MLPKDHLKGMFLNFSINPIFPENRSSMLKVYSIMMHMQMFGMSKVVAERNSNNKEIESSLSLQTVVSD